MTFIDWVVGIEASVASGLAAWYWYRARTWQQRCYAMQDERVTEAMRSFGTAIGGMVPGAIISMHSPTMQTRMDKQEWPDEVE